MCHIPLKRVEKTKDSYIRDDTRYGHITTAQLQYRLQSITLYKMRGIFNLTNHNNSVAQKPAKPCLPLLAIENIF